jgi:hypothetical protein
MAAVVPVRASAQPAARVVLALQHRLRLLNLMPIGKVETSPE